MSDEAENPPQPYAPANDRAPAILAWISALIGGWNASPPNNMGRLQGDILDKSDEEAARWILDQHASDVERPHQEKRQALEHLYAEQAAELAATRRALAAAEQLRKTLNQIGEIACAARIAHHPSTFSLGQTMPADCEYCLPYQAITAHVEAALGTATPATAHGATPQQSTAEQIRKEHAATAASYDAQRDTSNGSGLPYGPCQCAVCTQAPTPAASHGAAAQSDVINADRDAIREEWKRHVASARNAGQAAAPINWDCVIPPPPGQGNSNT